MNVVKVYEAAGELVEAARKGKGPVAAGAEDLALPRRTSRGNPPTYRSKAEEEEWLKKDPLAIARSAFADLKLLTAARAAQIEKEVAGELAKAVEFARASPFPEPAEALLDVFA